MNNNCLNCKHCKFPRSADDNGGACKCKIMKYKTIDVYVSGGETPSWCPLKDKIKMAVLEKFYYKIINDTTNEAEFYVSVDLPIKPEKLCETLCLKGYHAEPTTKEEYEKNAEDGEDG